MNFLYLIPLILQLVRSLTVQKSIEKVCKVNLRCAKAIVEHIGPNHASYFPEGPLFVFPGMESAAEKTAFNCFYFLAQYVDPTVKQPFERSDVLYYKSLFYLRDESAARRNWEQNRHLYPMGTIEMSTEFIKPASSFYGNRVFSSFYGEDLELIPQSERLAYFNRWAECFTYFEIGWRQPVTLFPLFVNYYKFVEPNASAPNSTYRHPSLDVDPFYQKPSDLTLAEIVQCMIKTMFIQDVAKRLGNYNPAFYINAELYSMESVITYNAIKAIVGDQEIELLPEAPREAISDLISGFMTKRVKIDCVEDDGTFRRFVQRHTDALLVPLEADYGWYKVREFATLNLRDNFLNQLMALAETNKPFVDVALHAINECEIKAVDALKRLSAPFALEDLLYLHNLTSSRCVHASAETTTRQMLSMPLREVEIRASRARDGTAAAGHVFPEYMDYIHAQYADAGLDLRKFAVTKYIDTCKSLKIADFPASHVIQTLARQPELFPFIREQFPDLWSVSNKSFKRIIENFWVMDRWLVGIRYSNNTETVPFIIHAIRLINAALAAIRVLHPHVPDPLEHYWFDTGHGYKQRRANLDDAMYKMHKMDSIGCKKLMKLFVEATQNIDPLLDQLEETNSPVVADWIIFHVSKTFCMMRLEDFCALIKQVPAPRSSRPSGLRNATVKNADVEITFATSYNL